MENSKTPPPDSPTFYDTACVEAPPLKDGKLFRLQKPAKVEPRQPLMETPTKVSIDSGYTSLSATPSGSSLEINRARCLYRGPIPLLFSKKKKVVFLEKPTDQSTRDRFRVIQPSFEKLLLEEMRSRQKPGSRYKPISTRLAMMGTSEDDAQPHIAIFCQPEQKKLIQAFIKKAVVADIYRPKDLGTPSFEVIVFGNAPRLRFSKSNIEVVTDIIYLPTAPQNTLCGIPISFQDSNGHRGNATFGGIIKVVTARGSTELLGITAGHVLYQWDHDSDEDMLDAGSSQNTHPTSLSPSKDDDEPLINDVMESSETDEDEYSEYELNYFPFSDFPGALVGNGSRLWEFSNPTMLGEVIDVFEEDTIRGAGQSYDWTLFEPMLYKMNIVPANPKAELRICNGRPGTIENRSVIVLSSPTGCKVGTISCEPGRILLGGEEFVDAFMVTMSEESGICDGDSGSWVVDATHFEVYGQLVASDVFGSSYIIPMTDILRDIKSRLGAQSVELPSFQDFMKARTENEEGRLATNVKDRHGAPRVSTQTISARTGSKLSTSTLDHHRESAILDSSDISRGSPDSGYSSLNPSPDPGCYLSSVRIQSPNLKETNKEQPPVAGIPNSAEEFTKNQRKRRLLRSQELEKRARKRQAMCQEYTSPE